MRNIAYILVALATLPCRARIITVDDDAPADFNNIQAAIDDANDGDTVIVEPGTYSGPGNNNIDFIGKTITVRSSDPDDSSVVAETIVDCNHLGRGFIFHSYETGASSLEGLTVSGGYGTEGGGIRCGYPTPSHPTIRNCVFRGNSSEYGGAVFIWKSSPRIVHCFFSDNSASEGGAIDCRDKARPTFINCTFIHNSAEDGGAIHHELNAEPTYVNCLFNNCTARRGAAAFGNYLGAAILINCTLIHNSADNSAGGIGNDLCSTVTLSNCILWGNTDPSGTGELAQIRLTTNPVYLPRINYNCIQGLTGVLGGEGNIGTPPLFVDPNGPDNLPGTQDDNLRLLPDSPAVDAGDNSTLLQFVIFDMDDNPRRIDFPYAADLGNGNAPIVDMGAYELMPAGTPIVALSHTEYRFLAVENGPNPERETLAIWNRGEGVLDWSIAVDCNWVHVEPSNGISEGTPNDVTISIDISALAHGQHSCVLSVFDPNTLSVPLLVTVELDVRAPTIAVTPAQLAFACPVGGPNPEPSELSIWNDDFGTLNWRITEDCTWLDASPMSGRSAGDVNEIFVSVHADTLDPGNYTCEVTISDANAVNSPVLVPVALDVRVPFIEVIDTPVQFEYTPGDPPLGPAAFQIRNADLGILNWQIIEDCDWLTVLPTAGQSSGEYDRVDIIVDLSGLEPGDHSYNLAVVDPRAGNSPKYVKVSIRIRTPLIAVTPAGLNFACPKGGPNPEPQALSVWNSYVSTLNWEITDDCDWLQVAPASGSSTGEVNEVLISIDATGLDGGTYNCTLTISDPNAMNSPQQITVNLDVQTSIIDLDPEEFYFTYSDGGRGGPAPQMLSIWNAGIQTLSWQLAKDCTWVEALPVSGESSGNINEVTISINPDELPTNNETCLLTISDPNSLNKSMTVTVRAYRLGTPLYVPSLFTTIQDAIDYAEDGDIVIVEPGIYSGPGNFNIRFNGKAITVRGTNPDDFDVVAATVIDCNQQGQGFIFDHAEDSNSVLSGLKITNGYGWGVAAGGAVTCDGASPIITNCILTGNHGSGGAIRATQGYLTVRNCIITHNTSGGYGGGIYGTGQYGLTVENCIISHNVAGSRGGGIRTTSGNVPFVVKNCIITANKAGTWGGGLSSRGGYIMVSGSIIADNVAGELGGGIHGRMYARPAIFNSIIRGNSAPSGPQIAVNEGDDGGWIFGPPVVSVSYSNVSGGQADVYNDGSFSIDWGPGNIDVDPCFADPGYWGHIDDPNIYVEPNDPNATWVDAGADYHLKSQAGRWNANEELWTIDNVTSLCIDAGDPTFPIGPEPFPNGGRINIGAYGGTAEASKSYFNKPPCQTIVAGDINGDCIIDGRDFALLARKWLVSDLELPSPWLPDRATNPDPADGVVDPPFGRPGFDLSWQAGHRAESHDVYFGTVSPGDFQGNQTQTIFYPTYHFTSGTYYWRIDEINPYGKTTGTVWTFSFSPPGAATNPIPADGATGVCAGRSGTFTLDWTAGERAQSHDIYFGTVSPGEFQRSQSIQTAPHFSLGPALLTNTYYWRIDEVSGAIKTVGPVWTFTVDGPPPATNPYPADGAEHTSVPLILSWQPGASNHDVYFGTESPGDFKGNQAGTTFDPGTLEPQRTYYWRIDEISGCGKTIGPVWTFKTSLPYPPTDPYPADGSAYTSTLVTLSWQPGAETHDVYFGTEPPGQFQGNQAATTFAPPMLESQKIYYWRIDEVNAYGKTAGPVWQFTCLPAR